MAGIMALSSCGGAVGIINNVKAAELDSISNAKAKIDHAIYSINKNYAGIKNQVTWEGYIKEARDLVDKIPSSESAEIRSLTNRIDGLEDTVIAIARINHVEKSLEENFVGIKNVPQWKEYLEIAAEKMKSIDRTVFEKKYAELAERHNKVSEKVKAVEDAHNKALAEVEKLYETAVESQKLEDANKALEEAKKLGSHSTTTNLINKIESLIKSIKEEENKEEENNQSVKDVSIAVLPDNYYSDISYIKSDGTATYYGNAFDLRGDTLVVGEKAKIYKVLEELESEDSVVAESNITVESSNPGVISVSKSTSNAKTLLRAESAGTATITIKTNNDVEKKITLNVAKEERLLKQVVFDKLSVTLAEGIGISTNEVGVKFLDQYGDPAVVQSGWFEVKNPTVSGTVILQQTQLEVFQNTPGKIGKGKLKLDANAGSAGKSGLVQIAGSSYGLPEDLKNIEGQVLASMRVEVTKNNAVVESKLEIVETKDYASTSTLDLSESKENKLILALNLYNSDGMVIGKGSFNGGKYSYESLDETVATVDTTYASGSFSGEELTVTAKKVGSTTIVVREKSTDKVMDKMVINVVNRELAIDKIDFKPQIPTITSSNKVVTLNDFLETEKGTADSIVKGITLTKPVSSPVRIAETNQNSYPNSISINELYVDRDNNGTFSEGDVKLGWVTVSVLDNEGITVTPISTSYLTKMIDMNTNKASGTVIVKVLKDKDNEKTSLGATSFKVDIK